MLVLIHKRQGCCGLVDKRNSQTSRGQYGTVGQAATKHARQVIGLQTTRITCLNQLDSRIGRDYFRHRNVKAPLVFNVNHPEVSHTFRSFRSGAMKSNLDEPQASGGEHVQQQTMWQNRALGHKRISMEDGWQGFGFCISRQGSPSHVRIDLEPAERASDEGLHTTGQCQRDQGDVGGEHRRATPCGKHDDPLRTYQTSEATV